MTYIKAKAKEIVYNHVTDWTLCKQCGWYYSEKEIEKRVCTYCRAKRDNDDLSR